jgi:uncharacterized membrane protein
MTYTMIAAGFLLHFLSRYGEHWRNVGKLGPREYVALDPVGWTAAVLGTVIVAIAFPELAPILGVDAHALGGALIAGYTGSSLTAKLPGIAGKGGVR